jgi:hypothetical protein
VGANIPGQDAGSQSRFPGDQGGDSSGRDGSAGDIGNSSTSGSSDSSSGTLGAPSGDYSLDTLPDGVLSGNGSGQAQGALTAAERAAILDERLRQGYETFDGFILGERERAQNESNAAGSVAAGTDGGGGGGGAPNQPQTLPQDGAPPAGVVAASPPMRSSAGPNETFPPPEDIPSGRDDDVVARQLREAAMSEPDPELREALWDEYRNYTGIGEQQ